MAVAAVLVLLSQGAGARWSANGDFEPDTHADVVSRRNWADPDVSPSGMKAYFDAVYIETTIGTNPNVGALGSRFLLPTALTFGAFLGVWKDCNRDGYIGHAESVLFTYPDALLTATDLCPPGSMWNNGGTVAEFIHFGPRAQNALSGPLRMFADREARVWGDFGVPHVPPIPDVGCVTPPVARGTFDSTGAILLMVDCNTDYNVARVITETDAILGLGIGFDGPGGYYRPDQDCDNPLNQQLDLYGDSYCNPDDPGLFEAGTGHRMVDVWDCAAREQGAKLLDVRDPTAPPGQRGELSYIPDPNNSGQPWTPSVVAPDPVTNPFNGQPLVITGPTLWITDQDGTFGVPLPIGQDGAGVWAEFAGASPVNPAMNDTDGSLEDTRAHAGSGLGSCANQEGTEGIGEPLTNGDFDFDPLRGKRRADFNFSWVGAGTTPVCAPLTTLCINAPVGTSRETPWTTADSYGPPFRFPNGVVRRDNMQPVGSSWFTFYAYVGSGPLSAGAQLSNPTTQVYGQEACGAFTSGVRNGWDCDPSHWWDSDFDEPNSPQGPRPGTRYSMRDTDCLDGDIGGGLGLFASLSPLSTDAPCGGL